MAHHANANLKREDEKTALMLAAEKGYEEAVFQLFSDKTIDVDARDKDGVNALVLAAGNGYESALSFLTNMGVSHGTMAKEVFQGFMQAAEAGKEQAFQAFLHFDGIDIDSVNEDSQNALIRAVFGGRLDMATKLLDQNGIDFVGCRSEANWTLLHFAVQAKQEAMKMVKLILDTCPASDVLNNVTQDDEMLTPLQMAVKLGKIDVVQDLLERGADVHRNDKGNSSALLLALNNRNYILTKLLLKHGAAVDLDIDDNDDEGKRLAIWFGVEQSELQLVEHFAHTEPKYEKFWLKPPCPGNMEDSCSGHLLDRMDTSSMVHLLLDWGDRVDARAHYRTSSQARDNALLTALSRGSKEVSLALLSRGARLRIGEEDKLREIVTSKSYEVKVPESIENWNELYWSIFSCDSDAVALALCLSTESLTRELDARGASRTAFDVRDCPVDRYPRVIGIVKQVKVLQATWKAKLSSDKLTGLFICFACIGALVIRLCFLRFQTMQKHYCWFWAMSPLWSIIVGVALAWAVAPFFQNYEGPGYYYQAAACVNLLAGAGMFLLVSACSAGSGFRVLLSGIKKRGNQRWNRCWEKLDSGLSLLLFLALLLKVVVYSEGVPALAGGFLHTVACTLPLLLPSPRRTTVLIRLLPGVYIAMALFWAFYPGSDFLPPGFAFEATDVPAALLSMTCCVLALTDIPDLWGAMVSAKSKTVVEIEMATKQASGKFTASKMIFGRAELAAHGIERALGLTPQQIAEGLKNPIEAMRREVENTGDINDRENFAYIVDGTSGCPDDYPSAVRDALQTGVYHGGPLGPNDFDKGHEGRTLADWMQVEEVVLANLTEAEFVAVRLYTSSSFPKINGPLRETAQRVLDSPEAKAQSYLEEHQLGAQAESPSMSVSIAEPGNDQAERHPWAMVVYLMDKGIKKLRSVQAQVDPEAFARKTVLWRGMKNMEVDIWKFKNNGGTEMAPMSTTTNEDVARHYAESKVPLVFKYSVGGMKTGVSIRFLSLFPKEEEFLYAPLTYLTLKQQYEDDGTMILVVEPVMS